MATNIPKKVIEYETFINDVLREDLKKVIRERDAVYQKLAEYLELRSMIRIMKESNLQSVKTKIDLGCNFYVKAEVPTTDYIFVNIGLGFHLQLTLDEALVFIEKKEKMLHAEVEKLSKESSKIKANIKLALEGLRELQGIPPDVEHSERKVDIL